MINLLPPQGKKRVLRNYWLRIVSVYFLLLGAAFLVCAVLLLPTYFYISYQINALSNSFEIENIEAQKQVESEIVKANEISKLLVSTPEVVNDSVIIKEVLMFSEGLASIGSITVVKNGREVSEVIVSGSAINRSSLLAFRDAAKEHRFFNEVNIPLSNLAKDQNIPFSLTLEPSEVLKADI
jgi:hypothetical protein